MPQDPVPFPVSGGKTDPFTGLARGSGDAGGSPSGIVGMDFYDNFEEMHNAWLNDIDDMVSPDEQGVIKSPYATYTTPTKIVDITKGNPASVEAVGHGLVTGDRAFIVGAIGPFNVKTDRAAEKDSGAATWRINGRSYVVTKVDDDNVTLDGINTTNFSTDHTADSGWIFKETVITVGDGNAEITAIQAKVDAVGTALTAMDPMGATGEYNTAVAKAITEASEILSDSDITDLVNAYERRIEPKYQRQMANFSRGMYDINAVNSTGFMMGHAYLEQDKRREVSEFHKELVMKVALKRADMVVDGVHNMLNLEQFRLNGLQSYALLTAEIKRLKISLDKDKEAMDITYTVKNEMWPLDRYAYGFNSAASILGALIPTPSQEGAPQTNAVGGALSGMALGAQIGTTIAPGVGTLIGAGLGAIAGIFS